MLFQFNIFYFAYRELVQWFIFCLLQSSCANSVWKFSLKLLTMSIDSLMKVKCFYESKVSKKRKEVEWHRRCFDPLKQRTPLYFKNTTNSGNDVLFAHRDAVGNGEILAPPLAPITGKAKALIYTCSNINNCQELSPSSRIKSPTSKVNIWSMKEFLTSSHFLCLKFMERYWFTFYHKHIPRWN